VFDTAGDRLVVQLWGNQDTSAMQASASASAFDDSAFDEAASPSHGVTSPNITVTVEWDGLDRFGTPLVEAAAVARGELDGRYELRWIDTSAVVYDWEGKVSVSRLIILDD